MVEKHKHRQSGFGYLSVLMLVMILGWVGASKFEDNQTIIKREKEYELLFILEAYHQAIESYYLASDDGVHALPETVENLLLDRRFIRTKRYLRKQYLDPVTGEALRLIRNRHHKIIGVYSQSNGWVLNQAGFNRLYKQKGNQLKPSVGIYREMQLVVDPVRLNKKLAQQKRLKNASNSG